LVEAETWKDGKKSFVITSKYPLYDANNTLIGTWGHSITVDALKYSEPIDEDDTSHRENPSVTKIDHLTQLKNVKAFYDDMNLAYQMGMNQLSVPNKDQSLIMIDINDFKALNDTYGHHGGDTALLFMTELLQTVKAPTDEIFIYGTDQFAILSSVTSLDDSKKKADQFIKLIESEFFTHDDINLQLLVTIGMCSFKEVLPLGSIYDIINLADSRLHEAKKLGPNQIVYKRL
jgi:diguanylate cyclase (GGDEF)-like protein